MGLTVHREAYIGLGSNVGDGVATIGAALRALDETPWTRVTAVSHAYESEAAGLLDQPAFVNAVARIEFDGEADALLDLLQDIETRLGRTPGPRWGPRPIDLDILLVGDEEWDSPGLIVPHPRLLVRDFVVTPLLALDPDVVLPDGRRPSPERATEGRVTADLGPVPEYGGEKGVRGEGAAAPVPDHSEAQGEWLPVGPGRQEVGGVNSGTDFDLLMYEAELKRAGIPCTFDPHRPNEGHDVVPGIKSLVRLMVPADRFEEAARIVAEMGAATPERAPGDGGDADQDLA